MILPCVLVLALLAEYRGGPALSFAHPSSFLALVAVACGVLAITVQPIWARRALAATGGVACAAVFSTLPALAWSAVLLVVLMHFITGRRGEILFFASASLLGFALAPASFIVAGVREVSLFGYGFIALKALLIALLIEGRKPREGANHDGVFFGFGLMALTLTLVATRVADVASLLSTPVEASWAEAPFLIDMLKLDAHQPLYGPLEQINSYTYSPLQDLLHHTLLAPFHAELSLVANRVVGLVDLFGASLLFAWAVAPHVKDGLARMLPLRSSMWGVLVALLVGFSSMLAGTIHPDHPSLWCIAVAFALVVREQSWPRWLWWAALVLVTPLSVAFKLTGAGVGLGLGAVMLFERRVRACAALALSALLALGTIPLFDATCGRFSTYAIGMQRSHPIEWARLLWAPTIHYAAATALALALVLMLSRGIERIALRRTALFFAGVCVLMLPAYLKFAGRENNLLALLVGCALTLLLAAALHVRSEGPQLHPLVGPAAVLYITMLVWTPPPAPSTTATPTIPLEAQMQEVLRTMIDDERVGEQTLVPSAALWIQHGRRDVPVDRTNSAYELFFGHHPEAELFFEHIEDGRYRSIVVWSGDLERTRAPAFADRLTSALSRYDRQYVSGYVIYRRR